MQLTSGSRVLDLATRARVVAVINVTPDSFHAPSRTQAVDAAVDRAAAALKAGADIVEIGGESTGPTSHDVTIKEESARVLPVVEAVRNAYPDAWIAVDTWKSGVAGAALAAGADLINDITAGRGDPDMLNIIAKRRCPYVLMYSKDSSARTTAEPRQYDDVVAVIHRFLTERIAACERAGINRSHLILDPGLGHFVSSDPKYSFEILRRLREFTDLGPILVSPSRKSFLAGPQNLLAKDRLPATLAASELAAKNGASLIRTHDVRETILALKKKL